MRKQIGSGRGSRRTFLQGLTATPLLPAVVGAASSPPATAAQVSALAGLVQAKFGSYLADGDMDEIKRGIERNIGYANALAKVKLTNADEPDFTFFAEEPSQD